jgi:hypothetical protein
MVKPCRREVEQVARVHDGGVWLRSGSGRKARKVGRGHVQLRLPMVLVGVCMCVDVCVGVCRCECAGARGGRGAKGRPPNALGPAGVSKGKSSVRDGTEDTERVAASQTGQTG